MLDVERQLRDYFEEVVERLTTEDVRVRVSTERGVRIPERRLLRLRPLAAGAIGFGMALTLLGVILVTDRLFAADVGDATGGPTGLLEPGTGTSPWLIIPVAIGLLTLIAGAIYMRHTHLESRGGEDMQTMERMETTEGPLERENQALKKRIRGLGWLAGILAVAAIALGAWLFAELSSSDGASLPSEVQAAYDGYTAGWAAHSGPEAIAFTTDDFIFFNGVQELNRVTAAQTITYSRTIDFRVEVIDSIATGDGPYYLTMTETVYFATSPEGLNGVSTYTIVNDGGTWKIQRHEFTGDPQ